MNEYTFSKLDIDKNQKAYHSKEITLRQGDKNGCEITATLYDHGQRITRTDLTVYFTMALPFGDYYYRKQATYNAGVVHITIDESTAASVPGDTDIAYFELRKGTDLIATTEAIRVHIEPSALADKEPGKNYDSAIQNAIDALTEATDSIPGQVQAEVDAQLVAHPEWTTTVQDNSVTDAKLIQSGGVLDRVGRLWWRLENLLTATPAEAEIVTVTDAAKTPVAGLTVFGKSTQDGTPTPDAPVAIQSVTPNLLQNNTASGTVSGITFTVGDDGIIGISGTATAQVNRDIGRGMTTLPAGVYSCGAGTGSGYAITMFRIVDGTASVLRNGFGTFRLSTETSVFMRVSVPSGATVDALVGPCIYAGWGKANFVPYGDVGLLARSPNLLPNDIVTHVGAGITFTVGSDGAITMSGTAAAQANQDIGRNKTTLPAGTYTCGTGTGSGYSIAMYKVVDGTASILRSGFGTFTLDAETSVFMRIVINSGATVNATVSPYIYAGSVTRSYVPYVTESVTAIPLDGHTLRSLPDGTRDEVTVDQYGHVTLIQRVGVATFTIDGATVELAAASYYPNANGIYTQQLTYTQARFRESGIYDLAHYSQNAIVQTANYGASEYNMSAANTRTAGIATNKAVYRVYVRTTSPLTVQQVTDMVTATPIVVMGALAEPVTHDLGTIDPTALVGPDMTAQAVPTAPFALTYERDLNATLARLEAALATLA